MEGCPGEVAFELVREKHSGRSITKHRNPEKGMCLVCLRNNKEVTMAGGEKEERESEDRDQERPGCVGIWVSYQVLLTGKPSYVECACM
jgi:hypothetical protein